MTSETPLHPDQQLWERCAAGAPRPGSCPEAIDLATWAEARGSENRREAIEAHLAECPACLEAVLSVRAAEIDDASTAPSAVIAAAKALVAAPAPRREVAATGGWRFADLLVAARWGLAAAAAIAICVVGYQAGGRATVGTGWQESSLVDEISFGVFDSGESDVIDIELVAMLVGGDS